MGNEDKSITYDSDLSSDQLRWLHFTAIKQDFSKNRKELERLQKEILNEKDAAFAYFFAAEFGYQTHLMQKLILDKKNVKYAFFFALNIGNADIKALQNIVAESNKTEYITKFACFVKGADRKYLERFIKNAKYATMYLKHVKGADANKFKEIIIQAGKPSYLFELAKHLSLPEDIERIENLIIESNSFTYMRMFAEKIKGSNVDKIEQALLDSNNSAEIKKFAKYVKKSKMRQFLLVG